MKDVDPAQRFSLGDHRRHRGSFVTSASKAKAVAAFLSDQGGGFLRQRPVRGPPT